MYPQRIKIHELPAAHFSYILVHFAYPKQQYFVKRGSLKIIKVRMANHDLSMVNWVDSTTCAHEQTI
jgi:hypothetical protein